METGSGEEEDILRHLNDSFLDKQFESVWKVAKVQKLNNEKVAQEFEGKWIMMKNRVMYFVLHNK